MVDDLDMWIFPRVFRRFLAFLSSVEGILHTGGHMTDILWCELLCSQCLAIIQKTVEHGTRQEIDLRYLLRRAQCHIFGYV